MRRLAAILMLIPTLALAQWDDLMQQWYAATPSATTGWTDPLAANWVFACFFSETNAGGGYNDESAYGVNWNPLAASNTPTFVPAEGGTNSYAQFDGRNDYLTSDVLAHMTTLTQGCVAVWVNQTETNAGQVAYCLGRTNANGGWMQFSYNTGAPDQQQFYWTEKGYIFASPLNSLDGLYNKNTLFIWQHDGIWQSAADLMWTNGVKTIVSTNTPQTTNWWWSAYGSAVTAHRRHGLGAQISGAGNSAASYFAGKMYSIRAYNRALTQSEITNLYYHTHPVTGDETR